MADPTPAPPAGSVLGEETYDEILTRIREPGAYVEQPHRYRAVWQAAAVAKYVAALLAAAEQRVRRECAAELVSFGAPRRWHPEAMQALADEWAGQGDGDGPVPPVPDECYPPDAVPLAPEPGRPYETIASELRRVAEEVGR